MSATIINLHRRPVRAQPHPCTADILAREIMREYGQLPIAVVEKALQACGDALAAGGTFVDALDAANKAVMAADTGAPTDDEAMRNFRRLMVFRRHKDRIAAAMLLVATLQIRVRMRTAPETEVQAAIERARRVLRGGGDVARALLHAIPDEPPGAA